MSRKRGTQTYQTPDGAGFVHLHVHSSYSLLEGAMKVSKIAEFAKADGMAAVALTDTSNLFGALEFSDKLASYGIQPIMGMTLAVDFADRKESVDRRPWHLRKLPRVVLLVSNEQGYRHLMTLTSEAYFGAASGGEPAVSLAMLAECSEGVIALTGGPSGPLDTALSGLQTDMAAQRGAVLKDVFRDRLYVELQRHGAEGEAMVEAGLLNWAYDNRLPIVATNEAYFAAKSDYEAHDALLAIAEGRLLAETERRRVTPEHRFKAREK